MSKKISFRKFLFKNSSSDDALSMKRTKLQEGRRHDQVALGGDLALEFVGQVDEGTSALHGESPEKLQEQPPAMRGCKSPLG